MNVSKRLYLFNKKNLLNVCHALSISTPNSAIDREIYLKIYSSAEYISIMITLILLAPYNLL